MYNYKYHINIIMAYHNTSSSSSTINYSSQNTASTSTTNLSPLSVNQTLYNYTSGDTLDLNGQSYTGYYNYTNGNFYTGRSVTTTSSFLSAKDNALANYVKEKLYFNRIPLVALQLPNKFDSLKFQPSEFVNQNSINEKLKKLNDNYLELFNFSAIQTNDLPENFTGFIGASGSGQNTFGFNTFAARAHTTISNAASGLHNIRFIEFIPTKLSPAETIPSSFLSVFATASAIYTFKCNNDLTDSTFTYRASAETVDGLNTRRYNRIVDIASNGKDLLYVSDSVHNQIYRLYLDPLINDSRITGNDIQYFEKGGVEINTTGNGILSTAEILEYGLGELYTFNSGTSSIIVLDKDLTFNRRFTSKEIKESKPVSMAINPADKHLYILLSNFRILKLNSNFKEQTEEIILSNSFKPLETPRKIIFSKNNSNIYYVITKYNVYKYFNQGENIPIGKFDWHKTNVTGLTGSQLTAPDENIWDAGILDENADRDSLFLLNKRVAGFNAGSGPSGDYTGVDKILRCNEPNSRISLLENQEFVSFNLNDILVNDQYFNNITLNKSFKKLIFNLDIFASYLHSKFLLTYDGQNELKLNTKTTLSATPYFAKEYDMFVGSNEVLTPQVLNRCVGRILAYQEYLVSILTGTITNKRYPTDEYRTIAT